ncbi:MAG: PEP-CTERM sorting domain-containing protein [Planctomycetaceae bacterium]
MSTTQVTTRILERKLALAAGAASLTLASGSAEGAIVAALGTPISPPTTIGSQPWDVDGDSLTDFNLRNQNSSTAMLDEVNGGRFVAPSTRTFDGFAKLSAGFVVGPTMSGMKFFASAQGGISVTAHSWYAGDASSCGWTSFPDQGYFGFKFTSGADTFYGWGEIALTGPKGYGISILQAYYNNTPGTAITVGDTGSAVPEPSTCALALLAAGGVAAYRARRKVATA